MPEDKKNQKRNDAKEQRKPRKGRQNEAAGPKKVEKVNEPKVPKVTVPQKPVYENPGPEFYKSLKRETEEIVKITEEEITKYKKKEIQSNWSKYEMPIESYEEIEEQENLGADYEKLIEAPLSVGGHFQFKHEKSWELNTGPSPYDKYFEINMENLCLAISTIPFYERNSTENYIFNESDILSMNNRATRFKQKYFNDKSYTTPEIEAQEAILKSLRNDNTSQIEIQEKIINNLKENFDEKEEIIHLEGNTGESINLDQKIQEEKVQENIIPNLNKKCDKIEKVNIDKIAIDIQEESINLEDIQKEKPDNVYLGIKQKTEDYPSQSNTKEKLNNTNVLKDVMFDNNQEFIFEKAETKPVLLETKNESKTIAEIKPEPKDNTPKITQNSQNKTKKPVIESPEDLEKWLDDFLDG